MAFLTNDTLQLIALNILQAEDTSDGPVPPWEQFPNAENEPGCQYQGTFCTANNNKTIKQIICILCSHRLSKCKNQLWLLHLHALSRDPGLNLTFIIPTKLIQSRKIHNQKEKCICISLSLFPAFLDHFPTNKQCDFPICCNWQCDPNDLNVKLFQTFVTVGKKENHSITCWIHGSMI